MTKKEALEHIKLETSKIYLESRRATGQKKTKLATAYRLWQSGLETAEGIYHEGGPDALERILAIKLHLRIKTGR